jgi:hypothetical protein
MNMQNLTDIKRGAVEVVLADLASEHRGNSIEAGIKLVAKAADAGLNLRDYLTLAIDTRQGDHAETFSELKSDLRKLFSSIPHYQSGHLFLQ